MTLKKQSNVKCAAYAYQYQIWTGKDEQSLISGKHLEKQTFEVIKQHIIFRFDSLASDELFSPFLWLNNMVGAMTCDDKIPCSISRGKKFTIIMETQLITMRKLTITLEMKVIQCQYSVKM